MYSLSPNPLALFQKYAQREITSTVLDAAAAIGKDALRDVRNGSRASIASQFSSLLFAGVTPLLTNAFFGWPAYLVILGIAADNLAVWLVDMVKPLFFPEEFESQWKEQCDVSNAVAVAQSVTSKPRKVDAKGIPVYRAIEPVTKPLDGYWQMGLLVAPLPLYWGSLFYPNAAAEKMRIETFVIVAIPTVVRLIWLLVAFIRNQRSAPAEIRALPQGTTQILAFLIATLLFVFGGLLFQDDHTGLGRYDGLAFFAIYLVCMSTSAAWSLQKTKEAERELRRFVAMDIDALKRRVQ
jgi:hypothetical protein